MNRENAVPSTNIVLVPWRGTDVYRKAKAWNVLLSRWDLMEPIDAMEAVGSGSHRWTDPNGVLPILSVPKGVSLGNGA